MKLIHEDTETLVGTGETGGPDLNLGQEFSKRFTWQDERDGSYWTVTATNYIRAVDHEGNDVEVDDEDELVKFHEAWQNARDEFRRNYDGGDWLSEAMRNWEDGNPEPIRYFWETQIEYIQHSDQDDPGSSELTSEYDNEASSYRFFSTKAEAEEDAKADMDGYSPKFFNPENF